MIKDIFDTPELDRYKTTYAPGQTIFLEGDASRDLYVLIDGNISIFKGSKAIAEISEPGSLFGEMSFLLESKRTATLKATTQVRAYCIPQTEIISFLGRFPDIAREISVFLARRLDETNRVVYGLKGLCDQIPDAVIMTDRNNRILSWNTAAEKLYGRDREQMSGSPVDEIYENPQAYHDFLNDVQSRYAVREKILNVKHPEKGILSVSTSTTILHDGHHNFQGVLSLGRDVTSVQKLKKSQKWALYWLAPLIIVICLLSAAGFFAIPYITRGYQTIDSRQQDLRNQMAKDYLVLTSLLANPPGKNEAGRTNQTLINFFAMQEKKNLPYTGILLLDTDRRVIHAHSIKKGIRAEALVGTSYGGIAFNEIEDSIHSVLSLYRTSSANPLGEKGIEIAFKLYTNGNHTGWLVFQMDLWKLESVYETDIKTLNTFRFKKP